MMGTIEYGKENQKRYTEIKRNDIKVSNLKIKKKKESNYEKQNFEENACSVTCSGYDDVIIRMRAEEIGGETGAGRNDGPDHAGRGLHRH